MTSQATWHVSICGHSNYQIGVSHLDTARMQLHHCIRSTFSLYWMIRILNIRVQNWLNIVAYIYDNRKILNKGDDEVRWWLSMGRSKVIIMVPIWKCVGLTPVWCNFPDVHHFHTLILKLFTIVLLIQWSPSHRGIDSDSTNWNQIEMRP